MVLIFMKASALARALRLRETCDALTAAMSALALKGRIMAGMEHRRHLARLQLSIWAAAATGARNGGTGASSMRLAPQDLSSRIERQGNYFAAGVALERDLST